MAEKRRAWAGAARPAAFHDLCAELTPAVEPDGPGAAFLRLARGEAPAGALRKLAARAVPALGERLIAGAGTNKLVAGAAARLLLEPGRAGRGTGRGAGRSRGRSAGAQAADVLVVPPGGEAAFLAPLPLSFLWPAEPAVLAELARMGVVTCGDLARVSEAALRRCFGRATAFWLSRWARGEDPRPVAARHPSREMSERAALDPACATGAEGGAVLAALDRLASSLAWRLQRAGLGCGAVRLCVIPARGPAVAGERPLVRPRNDARALAAAAAALWADLAGSAPGGVAAVEVTAVHLAPLPPAQMNLWEGPPRGAETDPRAREEALRLALAGLCRRFAREVVGRAGEMPSPDRRERLLAFWDPYRSRRAAPEDCPWRGW